MRPDSDGQTQPALMDEIERLELQIEELRDAIDRSRWPGEPQPWPGRRCSSASCSAS